MSVDLSVVVVAYDMRRELPRTLTTLVPPYQRELSPDQLEVIVVDNGSPEPVTPAWLPETSAHVVIERIDDAPPSPARAANLGIARARGRLVGLIVDGARMASPGLLATAWRARRLGDRVVVTTTAYHLGAHRHMEASAAGYDQDVEDRLLASVRWQERGYDLFDISTLAGSSGRGWFGPLGESSALFMAPSLWAELGGLDERFALPGGGLVNHDLYRRACTAEGTVLVHLLGEGTFHQHHGGAATSRRFTFEEMQDDYAAIRGERYRPPAKEPIHLGRIPAPAYRHLGASIELAVRRRGPGRPAGV